jgi:hypothetical protein
MNPVKRIGRYQLPILNVVAIQEREGVKAALTLLKLSLVAITYRIFGYSPDENWKAEFPESPGYDATLINGHVIHLTEEEKQQLDQERETHEKVMQVYGMAKGLGLRT